MAIADILRCLRWLVWPVWLGCLNHDLVFEAYFEAASSH
jgi:hypothetical protein